MRLGLPHGFPNGSFQPNGDLTAVQENALVAQLRSAIAARGRTAYTVGFGTKTVSGTRKLVLTTASGMTLYYFTPDSASKIACSGACTAVWP